MTAVSPSSAVPESWDPPPWSRAASAGRALVVALLAALVVAGSYAVFVRTAEGQRIDVLASLRVAQSPAAQLTLTGLLRDITYASIAAALAVCVVSTVARRRWALAGGACVLVAGASGTTESLKHVILTRPELGFGEYNTLPSGHMTVMSSLVFAMLLIVPRSARWLVQLVGSVGVAVVGVGTVVAGWHRPSDVVAGLAVTLAWGALVLAVISIGGVEHSSAPPRSHPAALVVGLVVSAAFFVALGVRPDKTIGDLVVLAVTMTGLAVAGALAIGVFERLVDARVA